MMDGEVVECDGERARDSRRGGRPVERATKARARRGASAFIMAVLNVHK